MDQWKSVLEKALIQECSTTFRKLELELLKQHIQQTFEIHYGTGPMYRKTVKTLLDEALAMKKREDDEEKKKKKVEHFTFLSVLVAASAQEPQDTQIVTSEQAWELLPNVPERVNLAEWSQ